MSTFCASCCLLLENSAPKPHWLIFQYYLKVLIRYCHKSMFFSLNFDVWNIWGRTLGKCTILHSLGSPHWLSIFIHYLWAQSKHPVIQGSSVGTWVTCKMRAQKFLPHSASVQGGSCNFYILKISSYFIHNLQSQLSSNSAETFLKILSEEAFEDENKKAVLMLQLGVSSVAIYDFRSFKSP